MKIGRRSARGALAIACAALLAPASASAAQLVVDDDKLECPSAGYTTIAAAVAAAQAGDTISVCHGVYREGPSGPGATSLMIEKSLTIKGEGAGRVYVGPTGDLAAAAPNLRDSAGNIISVAGAEVNISGITVFGANRHVEAGIHYRNADGIVSSVEIVDMARAGMYDGVTGVGLFAWGNEADNLRSVTLSDSLVESYDAAGVVADAALENGTTRASSTTGLFFLLSENRISGAGAGAGIAGQDGYRVLNRASTVAIENAITDNSDAGIDVQNSANTSQTRFNRNNIQRNRLGFRHEAAFTICPNDPGRTNKYRLDAIENWWGSPLGPSTDDVAGRGDQVSGNLAGPTGCNATTGIPDTTDRVDFGNFLTRPSAVPTPLGLFVDRQPTVDITAPPEGTKLSPYTPLTITAAAADDIGVNAVTFLRGDEVLAVDKQAPYQVTYTPDEAQAWTTQSIVAVVTDSRGQSGGDAISVGANDDAAPFVELLRPTRENNGAFRLYAIADDDRDVEKVTFFVDGEKACTDRRPPYQCKIFPEFIPRDRLTIVAIATDTAGQTSTDLSRFRLPSKLKPKGLSLHADANNSRVFADGRLKLPRTVDDRDGCDGKVEVEVRRQGDVVESEKVKLDRDCEYAVALRVRRDGRYRVTARFLGNDLLRPISAEPEEVKVG
jgi:Bacterial Ig domain